MIARLLVGYDGSESARAAFDFALDMAGRYGAELHVLAVAHPPDIGEDQQTEVLINAARGHYAQALQALKPRVEGLKTRFAVKVGHPAEQILGYAEGHGIDHIVVGHRGRTLFERWLIGSIARRVLAYAPCPVTVVRPRA
ncbi:universal stress protein [uncultured Thiodictyon sp.]|jgi:nucleotide-binding universal stress UspA family protein|uniref:universal stress protein n=1 Tax=uncultured Thiodictyon sp. TaxID=1846217 RepID=UPI0025E46E7D|nr:universal stress protein [uncultured Thiodictyon sp.]